jgi:hypothetical protein
MGMLFSTLDLESMKMIEWKIEIPRPLVSRSRFTRIRSMRAAERYLPIRASKISSEGYAKVEA